MCDKRFMPKNRSNVGENVTINAAFQLSSPFQLLKKTEKVLYCKISQLFLLLCLYGANFRSTINWQKNQLSYCDSIMYQSFVTQPPSLGPGEQRNFDFSTSSKSYL